jgi:endonuclease/exonuclease/phosphatase family metal-dependent hydrolase
MQKLRSFLFLVIGISLLASCKSENEINKPDKLFDFNNNVKSGNYQFVGNEFNYTKGLEDKALSLTPDKGYQNVSLDSISLNADKSFSIQCWIKTTSKNPTVFLSYKNFENKGIINQMNTGWSLYSSDGTFAWSIGSGERRINYERDNGELMAINDGVWHQLTITYNKELSEFRLYYDGHNKAIYKVNFDFSIDNKLQIGATENNFDFENKYSSDIVIGQENLQELVDEFNKLGLEPLNNEELTLLIVNPEELLNNKLKNNKNTHQLSKDNLANVLDIRIKMGLNPYTVFQNMKLTVLKPVTKIYSLQAGKVVINKEAGKQFTKKEQLFASDFAIDNLSIWDKAISAEDVLNNYNEYKSSKPFQLKEQLNTFNVGVWNIWHGGIHWSLEKDGWDSRMRIVEMIKEKNLDVVLMQETYSNGDFIAAELGYYFATTSDWDYKYQGSNISVLSKYPIKQLEVSEETEFNNVAVKLAISKTQEVWAMSNWYGMNNFQKVFDFHKSKFELSDSIPVLFGGDFNAVPHTDGGDSPASIKLMEEGFTDAYRSLYQNIEENPGFTHQGNVRIDQLFYKGKSLTNTSTKVISTWPSGFPSDHYLIVSKFELSNQ